MSEIEYETDVEATYEVLEKKRIKWALDRLEAIIIFSGEKRYLKGNSDKKKQEWTRLESNALGHYGRIIHDDVMERIVAIEDMERERKIQESNR